MNLYRSSGRAVAAMAAAAAFSTSATAQLGTGGTLTDGSATFTQGDVPTDAAATAGPLTDFIVGGSDHLFQSWWWLRGDGDTREFALSNADSASWVGNVGKIQYTAFDARISVTQTYLLTSLGTNAAVLSESLTLLSTASTPVTWNVFHYLDADVDGDFSDDSADTIASNVIAITDGLWHVAYEGTDVYQVAPFADIRDLLTDGAVTNLDNSGLPFGPDDFTGAFQWTVTLDPGEAVTLTGSTTIVLVPAPAAGGVLALAGLALGSRRRRPEIRSSGN